MGLESQLVLSFTCTFLFPAGATLSLILHLVYNHLAGSWSIQLSYITVLALQLHMSAWFCVVPSIAALKISSGS